MREPERIERIMSLLTKIWKHHPDLRFNQLINNLQWLYAQESGNKKYINEAYKDEVISGLKWGTVVVKYVDLFYVEDDKFEEFLIKHFEKFE